MSRDHAYSRRASWMWMFRRWLQCVCLVGSAAISARSLAEPACGQRPWIAVNFLEATWPAHFRETVLADLRASLSERRIDVCLPAEVTIRRAIANITLTAPSSATVSIVVVANDEKAQKRVSRTVSLVGVPSDGQPFAVALATDELLQASWSELALLPPEVETHQAPVVRSEPAPPPPPAPDLSSLTGAAFVDWFLGKQGYGGGELRFRRVLTTNSRWSIEGGLGGSLGRKVHTDNGTVNSSAVLGAAWLRYGARVAGEAQLGVGLGTRLGYHVFTGKAPDSYAAAQSVSSSTADGWVSSLMGRIDTRIPFGGPFFCDLGAELGFPLRGLQVTDSGSVVTGATGLRFTPSVGAGVQW